MPTNLIRVTESIGYFKTEPFMKWREKVGKREANLIAKRAEVTGNRVDEIIKSGNYETLPKDNKAVRNCIQAFLKWKERYQVGTLIIPERLTDEAIGLTGHPDLFWQEQEEVIDIKCTKQIWPEHFFQLGGYKRLGIPARKASILRLDQETAEPEPISCEKLGFTIDMLVDAFESNFKHYQYYTCIEKRLKGE